jgi:O-antigen ligase
VLLGLFVWRLPYWQARVAFVVAMLLLAGLGWQLADNMRNNIINLVHEIMVFKPDGPPTRAGERLVLWTKSVEFVKSAPLIGHGTGSIREQFKRSVEGRTGMAASASANPHNQTFAIAIQLGLVGTAVLFALWGAHLLVFRDAGVFAWAGLVVVSQNIVGSLFNSHLLDFTHGWIYVVGVGVAAGATLKRRPSERH